MAGIVWRPPREPPSTHKTKWSAEEDEQLRQAITELGTGSWNDVSRRVPTRTGKQCRERWVGQLSPTISREIWQPSEDAALYHAHCVHGNQWTIISLQMPGRSSLSIKNRWNWLLRHCPGGIPAAITQSDPLPDVFERKPCTIDLAPVPTDGGLFGPRFREFQAKMFV
jgi:hypothetical protein